MRLSVAKGYDTEYFELNEKQLIAVLEPKHIEVKYEGEAAVREALKAPIGTDKLANIVKPGEKIVIITSDLTRPIPSYQVLPPILEELEQAGCRDEDITIVFALGSHRKQTATEMEKLVGADVYKRIKCIDGDADDVVSMGVTSDGTPVDVDRTVAEADRRICLANIEYHYFAGYSGGAKAIMPGVSTRAAIQNNHRRMVEARAFAGNLEDNPVRKDLEEAINYCPIDFIVNVVLDEHKKIIHAVAGHFITAHRAGCAYLDSMYRCYIDKRADIVIVSQGGAPKDINLYQTQKALDNAKHAVKDGGIVILVGSCKEGMGEEVFEEWMLSAAKPSDLTERIAREFRLGGHKAAAIALVMEKADIYLVSDFDDEFTKKIFMTPFNTVEEALRVALEKQGADAEVIVMPYGGSTLPTEKQ